MDHSNQYLYLSGCCHQPCFYQQAAGFTCLVRQRLVNIVEHLAAKEPDILSGVVGDHDKAKKRVNIALTFVRWTQALHRMKANVS